MIKNLFLVLLLAVQTSFAQIISKDFSFASNGEYLIPFNISSTGYYNYPDSWSMVQSSDNSIYVTYSTGDVSLTTVPRESFVLKLTPGGVVNQSFGTNGRIQLPHHINLNKIKRLTDGKLLIFGFNETGGATVYRMLPNGQLDPTFGTGGISVIPQINSGQNYNAFGFLLQNDKIIIHGINGNSMSEHYNRHIIYRLNANGSIDSTFGTNGVASTQGSTFSRMDLFIDNQSNINCFNNDFIQKFDSNGLPMPGYGNNGVVSLADANGFGQYGTADHVFMDSNNKFIFVESLNTNGVLKINPDGTVDHTFTNNLYASFGTGTSISNMIEKNGYYYIVGYSPVITANGSYFISKISQNGVVDSSFGYYLDANIADSFYPEMFVNSDNIITNTGIIVKYLLNSSTLSTKDITKITHDISFENPVKQNLIFSTKEKVSKIEIYSVDGKIVKTLKDNNTDLSELLKGVYLAKVTFENRTKIVKKLIKN
ncbi:hypothetical protein B0A69_02235 [Chryseobacterium shigense]|uniref:Delta-60 repeat domain-containing protein/Por secretion system C-terminal sorting domain-containing protein n=1 Tax=Chryseobacterium shigense TaxID=297244 RepID=A0A1N7I974_9FLAO|nr:T9SS type A sorting domain-containing protein [Chryseobacterium shigense]PQA96905.1 hypothetical protein B0A69_02235 [Chryseobacterium shigense]SIS33624.1 delta-60 repeat domain-containing protein/Por secretion system C-terminal sorting domain-containing protein [Chryseobacterium shigense]